MVNPASGSADASTANDISDPGELGGSASAVEIAGAGNILIENNDMVYDIDTAIQNQTNIFMAPNPSGSHSGVMIRGNHFSANTRNISCSGGWDNVTVENNTFVRSDAGVGRSGSGILVITEPTQPGATLHNWTIRNNTFTYSNDSGVAIMNTRVENLVIDGNTFTNSADFNNVTVMAMGGPVEITNNTFSNAGDFSVLLANAQNQPTAAAIAGVLVSGNQFGNPYAGVSIGADVTTGVMVENNQINQIRGNVVFSFTGGNSSGIVRNNHVDRGGGSSCVNLNARAAAILNNYFDGGHRGVAMFGQNTFTYTPGDNLVRGNLVIEPGLTGSGSTPVFGVGDWSGGGVSGYIPSQNNRIINNTIVLSAGDGIFLSAPGSQVYNNISAFNVEQGVDVSAGGTPSVLDFNLVFQNQGGNYGGTSGGVHSLVTNPEFVTFFGVSAGADFHLQPQSAARNAGSGNGLTYDYVTDLGAYQDAEVDTSVPVSGWGFTDDRPAPSDSNFLQED